MQIAATYARARHFDDSISLRLCTIKLEKRLAYEIIFDDERKQLYRTGLVIFGLVVSMTWTNTHIVSTNEEGTCPFQHIPKDDFASVLWRKVPAHHTRGVCT